MAHNLNTTNGKVSFMSVKEKAWHGLGQIVDQYPTSAEAIVHAGLDFHIAKVPVQVAYDGNVIEIPEKFATIRTDTKQVLGTVGGLYEVLQNVEAFEFFDKLVGEEGGIKYETAGALGKGERIFITAKMPDYMRIGNDDIIEKYLFLTTSHDGSKPTTVAFTPTRIVCNNTLNAAMKNMSNTINVMHFSGSKAKLDQYAKIVGLCDSRSKELEELFNKWAKVKITDKAVRKLIENAMAPNKETLDALKSGNAEDVSFLFTNSVNDVLEYAASNDSQQMETTKGTVFGAYNAITGYYQNVKSYKNDEVKLGSIIYGGTAQVRAQKAFDLCNEYAKKGNLFLN